MTVHGAVPVLEPSQVSEIAIYQTPSGGVEVRLDKETVWLRLEQMAELFSRDRTVVGRHVRSVFADAEIERESNVQNLHIAGADKPVGFYSLDVIISVGYRVKSPECVRFRQWATALLRVPSGASCRQFIEMTTRFLDVSPPAT